MDIVAFSDTHERHWQLEREIGVPEGDMLIFAGDATVTGKQKGMELFIKWWNRFDHQHKIFVGGNHDHWINAANRDEILDNFDNNTHYLEDDTIEINGLTIHGTPWTPVLGNEHPMRRSNTYRDTVYQKIPDQVDILVTHTPPHGHGDKVASGRRIGDELLAEHLEGKDVGLHLFGHCHGNHGMFGGGRWNVSVTDNDYIVQDKPVELQLN